GPRREGRARRGGDALEVEVQERRLALDALDGERERVGDALAGRVHAARGDGGEEAALEAVAQRGEAGRHGRELAGRELRRRAEAHGEGHVLGARAAAALLTPAVDERRERHAAPDPERAHA